MNNNLGFDFSVDKENKTIKVKREFAAELPLVWDAYTKSEILDQWWAPKPLKSKTKTMDFKEGGHWQYAMVGPEGEEHWAVVNYETIQFQKKFTGLDAFADENGNVNEELPQAKWEVNFIAKGEKTQIEIHIAYNSLADLETIIEMGFKEGLAMGMEGLDELLVTLRK